jgi:hypothetical protein
LAIGFGEMMENTDMVLFKASGAKGDVVDLWSEGHDSTYPDTI